MISGPMVPGPVPGTGSDVNDRLRATRGPEDRSLVMLKRIARRLAESDDVIVESSNGRDLICLLCSGHGPMGDRLEHDSYCPYQLALDWMEEYGEERNTV